MSLFNDEVKYFFPVETEFSTFVDIVKENNSSIVSSIMLKICLNSIKRGNEKLFKNDAELKGLKEGVFIYRYYNTQGSTIIREEIFTPRIYFNLIHIHNDTFK